MSMRQLQTFVEIADTGSFSAAAERMFVTQSAVSMQMKALETEWNVTLFDRRTRPPVLNNTGWRLVPHARRLVAEYRDLADAAAAPVGELSGSIRLGVVPTVATGLLPRTLQRLRQLHPGIRLRVESGLSPDLLAEVAAGRLDTAIVTAPSRADPAVALETIRSEPLELIVHREDAAGSAREMLARFPFLRFNPAMGVGRIIDDALRENDLAVDDAAEVDSIEAICRMVYLRLGVAILPTVCVPEYFRDHLATRPLDVPSVRTIALAARRSSSGSPILRAVYDAFVASAASDRKRDWVERPPI